jgi:hypothetical protein
MQTMPDPQISVLERLLASIGRVLTPEVARQLVALQADPAVQARLEELADKCTEGQLSAEEHAEYEVSVRAIEYIGVLQAKARHLLSNNCTRWMLRSAALSASALVTAVNTAGFSRGISLLWLSIPTISSRSNMAEMMIRQISP